MRERKERDRERGEGGRAEQEREIEKKIDLYLKHPSICNHEAKCMPFLGYIHLPPAGQNRAFTQDLRQKSSTTPARQRAFFIFMTIQFHLKHLQRSQKSTNETVDWRLRIVSTSD